MSTTSPEGGEVTQLRWRPVLALHARLRMVRKDYGRRIGVPRLTQAAFAVMLGANPNTYKQWEAGHSKPADLEVFAKTVHDVTGCDPAWLLGVADDAPSTPPGQEITRRACNGNVVPFGPRAAAPLAVAA